MGAETWTSEQTKRLIDMWMVGTPRAEIAAALNLTRRAVSSKASRLKLGSRPRQKRIKEPSRLPRWSPEDCEQLCRMARAGKMDCEIAAALNRSVSGVKSKRQELVSMDRRQKFNWTPAADDTVRRMAAAGATNAAIGAAVGCSPSAAHGRRCALGMHRKSSEDGGVRLAASVSWDAVDQAFRFAGRPEHCAEAERAQTTGRVTARPTVDALGMGATSLHGI